MAKPLDKKTVEKKTAKPGKKPGGMASNKRKSSSGGAGGGEGEGVFCFSP